MTAVYEWYDSDNRLLYVGISENVARRSGEHEKSKSWWADVARSKVTHYSSRSEALEVERVLIKHHKPLYNVTHNERRVQRPVLSESRHRFDNEEEGTRENIHEQVMECMNLLKDWPPTFFQSTSHAYTALRNQGHVIRRSIVSQALRRIRGEAIPGGEWVFGEPV